MKGGVTATVFHCKEQAICFVIVCKRESRMETLLRVPGTLVIRKLSTVSKPTWHATNYVAEAIVEVKLALPDM